MKSQQTVIKFMELSQKIMQLIRYTETFVYDYIVYDSGL